MRRGDSGIIVVVVFLITITIIYFGVFANKDKKSSEKNEVKSKKEIVVDNEVKEITSRKEAYEAKTCFNKFFAYCKTINIKDSDALNDVVASKDEAIEALSELLDSEYKGEFEAGSDVLEEKFKDIDYNYLQINDMYIIQRYGDIVLYYIKSQQIKGVNDTPNNMDILIKIDKSTNTFSVFLDDYIISNGYDKLSIGDSVKIELNNIKEKTFNIFDNPDYSISVYQNDLFNDFKISCIYNVNRAYDLLDKSTKENRFKTKDEFKNYVKNNSLKLFTMKIDKCSQSDIDGSTSFEYVTDKDIAFVITEKTPLIYTVKISD